MKNIATLQNRGQTIQSQLHQQTFIQAILMSVIQHTKKKLNFHVYTGKLLQTTTSIRQPLI